MEISTARRTDTNTRPWKRAEIVALAAEGLHMSPEELLEMMRGLVQLKRTIRQLDEVIEKQRGAA